MSQNPESYNLQTKTRFIFNLPIEEVLGDCKNLKDFKLNVQGFSTPEIAAGVVETNYQGYPIPIPNGNRVEDKVLTVRFLVSENLIQYAAMLKWINKVTAFQNRMAGEENSDISDAEPQAFTMSAASLWVLDSYLKPQIPITYKGLFISRLGQLVFDHEDESGDILTCTASFHYFESALDVNKIIGQIQ